jgi:ubiquinone/menaquinone biosynthesis C-methylase UbiE
VDLFNSNKNSGMEENLNQGFDHLADAYDNNFTFSAINSLQRKQVLSYVEKNALNANKLDILEINCGTGEDAIYFEKLGHKVLATDASSKMIKKAQSKMEQAKATNLLFRQVAFSEIHNLKPEQNFDLVFSNFGGLNCISTEELKILFEDVVALLKNDGRFIGVVMPKFCLLEFFYFLIKLQWGKLFRRYHKDAVMVNLNGVLFKTWYFSPSDIKNLNQKLRVRHIIPIGIALPPTYLEGFFKRKPLLLKFLNSLESGLNKIPFFAGFSDHFLFDLQKAK